MCKHGDTIDLMVNVPADLSSTGQAIWKVKPIDRCIFPIVDALIDAKIYTRSCCCGHDKSDGSILLQDGRELIIKI